MKSQLFRKPALAGVAAAVALAWAPQSDARVTRIVVDTTTAISGQPYDELTGRAFGELDPRHHNNRNITDIELAPRNARGKVEYIASFRIRKPTGTSSGVMWHDVPNRGGNVATRSRRSTCSC